MDLADTLERFPAAGAELSQLRAGARADFERQYESEVVYKRLMEIYKGAIAEVRGGAGARRARETGAAH